MPKLAAKIDKSAKHVAGVVTFTNEQKRQEQRFRDIFRAVRRAVIQDEIRTETQALATTRHACECGESCRRIMCASCWRSLLEIEP